MRGGSCMFRGQHCTLHALVVLTLLAFMWDQGQAVLIPMYNVEDYCGYYLSQSQPAGIIQIHFNKTSFFVHREFSRTLECMLKVAPEQVAGSVGNGKVMFYFSEFNLPGTCNDLSLTLVDGVSKWDPAVKGAPLPLCTHNTSLTRGPLVFNTSTPAFALRLRWAQPVVPSVGGFMLKFASYYDGPCNNSADAVMCQNTRCTSKDYHCLAGLDTCGGGEAKVCHSQNKFKLANWDQFTKKLFEHLGDIGFGFLGVIIAVYFLFKILKGIRKRYGSVVNCLRNMFGNTDHDTHSRTRSLTPSTMIGLRNTPTANELSDSSDDEGDYNTPPPAYSTLEPSTLVAPPSYEEFITNEDKYRATCKP